MQREASTDGRTSLSVFGSAAREDGTTMNEPQYFPGRRAANCRSCGASIFWFRTSKDKAMPVDAETVGADDATLDLSKHRSHFATCPNAAKHRKPRS